MQLTSLEELETSDTNSMVRCRLCKKHALANCKWIQPKGWSKHKKTLTHLASEKKQEVIDTREQQETVQAAAAPTESVFVSIGGLYEGSGLAAAGLMAIENPLPRQLSSTEEAMWQDYDTGHFPDLEMEDPEKEQAKRACDFERRIREFDLWSGVDGHPDGSSIQQDLDREADTQRERDADIADIIEAAGT
jgi:hypothetical protein